MPMTHTHILDSCNWFLIMLQTKQKRLKTKWQSLPHDYKLRQTKTTLSWRLVQRWAEVVTSQNQTNVSNNWQPTSLPNFCPLKTRLHQASQIPHGIFLRQNLRKKNWRSKLYAEIRSAIKLSRACLTADRSNRPLVRPMLDRSAVGQL